MATETPRAVIVTTRYLGPTDHRGSRIVAEWRDSPDRDSIRPGDRVTVS